MNMTASLHSPFDPPSSQFRHALVAFLVQSGALRSSLLEHAFKIIPRELFVPIFYEDDDTRTGMAWREIHLDQTPPEEYLAKIYQDTSLVTKVDTRQWPVSSSSMPSVMAKMLEALDVHPGQRILELGTGTGYNAALLATILGDPGLVTTIEADEDLANRARDVLCSTIGTALSVIHGDGFAGYAPHAPYDRVLATASAPTIPPAWLNQLAVGGRLVMDLQGPLASGFLVLDTTTTGGQGHFLSEPLYFMPLQSSQIETPEIPGTSHLMQQPCTETFHIPQGEIFPDMLFDPAFRWFLQWQQPACRIRTHRQLHRQSNTAIQSVVVLDLQHQSLVRFRQQHGEDFWQGEVYGPDLLWQALQKTYEDFIALGQPTQREYQVILEQGMPVLTIGPWSYPLSSTNARAARQA